MLNTPLPYTELGRSSPPNGHAFVHWSAKLVDSAIIVMLLVGPTLVRSQDWPLRYTIALMLAWRALGPIAASRLLETEKTRRFALVYGEGNLADRLAQTTQQADALGLKRSAQHQRRIQSATHTSPNTDASAGGIQS